MGEKANSVKAQTLEQQLKINPKPKWLQRTTEAKKKARFTQDEFSKQNLTTQMPGPRKHQSRLKSKTVQLQ